MTGPANPPDPPADRLRARYPGWRIWHVPARGGRGAYWSAQPARFPLVAGSAEELAAAIDADQPGEAGA